MDQAPAPPVPGQRLGFSRILITGADGFVGKHLLPALQACSDAALFVSTGLDVGALGQPPSLAFDLTRAETVAQAIEQIRPDLVIHLAGQASVGLAEAAAAGAWTVNFGGTFAIAQALARFAPACTMFFVSSAEVYGRALLRGRATEATPPEPISAYARSKAAAEWMLADVLPAACRLITVRPSNHTGPGQATNFVAPAFAEQIAQLERAGGGEIRVGNLESERDFLDVRDVVGAYLALLAQAPGLPQRALFNVASGAPVKIGFILERLRAGSAAAIQVVADPARARPSEIARAEIDAAWLRTQTGWRPAHDLDATLRAVLEDFRVRAAAT